MLQAEIQDNFGDFVIGGTVQDRVNKPFLETAAFEAIFRSETNRISIPVVYGTWQQGWEFVMYKSFRFAAALAFGLVALTPSINAMMISVPKTLNFSAALVSRDLLSPQQISYVAYEPWVNAVIDDMPLETASVTAEEIDFLNI